MTELYKWCPFCNKEELIKCELPEIVKIGTDGYGQPVRYSECECGNLYGWFNVGMYRWDDDDFIFDSGFEVYLKWRIKFYLNS